MSHLTIGTVARELEAKYGCAIPPRHISDLFYKRLLTEADAPIIAGRRMIPRDLVETIEIELRRAGRLPRLKPAAILSGKT